MSERSEELERLALARAAQEFALETQKKIQATIVEGQKNVDALSERVDTILIRLNELEARLLARQGEQQNLVETLEQAEDIRQRYADYQDGKARLAAWDQTASAFREHEALRAEPLALIREEKVRLETELERLVSNREKVEKNLPVAESRMMEIETLEIQHGELNKELSKKAVFETDMQAALENQAAARSENPRLKSEMEELKVRITQLEATSLDSALCPVCGQTLTPTHRSDLIGELQKEGKEKGDQYRQNQEILRTADERVKDLRDQLNRFQGFEEKARKTADKLSELKLLQSNYEALKQEWEEKEFPRLAQIESAITTGTFAPDARETLAQIDAELKEIGYDAAGHDALRQEILGNGDIEDQIRLLDRAAAALEPLEREIKDLRIQVGSAENEVEQLRAEHERAAAALAENMEAVPNIYQTQRDLLELQERENQLRYEVGAAQQKVDVLGDLRTRKASLQAERNDQKGVVARYQQLERALGRDGVPALLVEQALPQIERKANELLERLSGGEMSVRFLTQRELKTSEDLKETLDIQISDRAGIRDYEMYSGGEAFRVNFAIRLALSEVLAHRAGARLQTLVIDEGFGSQDEVGRQRLLEAINLIRDDFEKVLVITHIEAFKDVFPTRIEVVKGEGGSQVEIT